VATDVPELKISGPPFRHVLPLDTLDTAQAILAPVGNPTVQPLLCSLRHVGERMSGELPQAAQGSLASICALCIMGQASSDASENRRFLRSAGPKQTKFRFFRLVTLPSHPFAIYAMRPVAYCMLQHAGEHMRKTSTNSYPAV
jgi:hypothetical protein